MRMLGVPVEGPLVLPCCSHAAAAAASASTVAGFRSPAIHVKSFAFTGRPKSGFWTTNYRTKGVEIRAMANSGESKSPIAPLRLESPTGQLLSQIMRSHPHLLPATIDQQIERLQLDRDSQEEESSRAPQDLLYKRIAEVKERERERTLEEIIYCLIVQQFMEREILMIPKIIPSSPDLITQIDSWPNQESKLESVHSPDALEMIQSHLSIILGERQVGPLSTIVQISKLKLGKLYAASIMYGYFLKRVDGRYQLERKMKTLPTNQNLPRVLDDMKPNPFWDLESMVQIYPDEIYDEDDFGSSDDVAKSYRLRTYVMYLDAETLQRYATIRSKEAVSVIERQTQALFGRPDIVVTESGSLDALNDEIVAVSFSGLTMLVLEAVAFGSFLWDAEGYVESKYPIINS